MPKRKPTRDSIRNVVVVSDTHVGCKVALCPDAAPLDDGGSYVPSALQRTIKSHWDEFWGEWVPEATHGEPFAVVHNGDCIDGVHHGSTTQWSHNLEDQGSAAVALLKPIVEACEGRYYHIRGTEAHVGKSGVEEERVAKSLGAKPNAEGQHARYELWLKVGEGLVHLLHHVGTTGSAAYEATAVHKELTESFVEAGRWDQRPPDMIVRSHRHRCIKITIPTARHFAQAVVTPCWQGKTPFAWKIPGARLSTPQFGGILIRVSDDGILFSRERVWTLDRSPTEEL